MTSLTVCGAGGETINIGRAAPSVQYNPIQNYIEGIRSRIWIQCAERTIDKFRNATNCFIAQLPKTLGLAAGPPQYVTCVAVYS